MLILEYQRFVNSTTLLIHYYYYNIINNMINARNLGSSH